MYKGYVENLTIPIVLSCSTSDKQRLEFNSMIALYYNDTIIGILRDPEFFEHRKEERCARTFGTVNIGHPYIKVMNCNSKLVYLFQ